MAFSASEPVICSAYVDFVAAITSVQASSISFFVVRFVHHGISRISVPGSLQGRREWLALRLLIDGVKELGRPLALVQSCLQFCGGIRGLASLAKLLLAWFAGLPAVVVGALGDPWVARRGPYFAGLFCEV
jgi:hypothetical protein